jgi:hypothetical protein
MQFELEIGFWTGRRYVARMLRFTAAGVFNPKITYEAWLQFYGPLSAGPYRNPATV